MAASAVPGTSAEIREAVADSKRVAVLVSGHGLNLQALLDSAADPASGMAVVLVGADRPDAYGLGPPPVVDTAVVRRRPPRPRRLRPGPARPGGRRRRTWVCLAGFMRILGPAFVRAFPRILNTHPSLLPAFRGAHAVRDALAYGVKVTGCTVHLVDEEVDHGPVLFQAAVPVEPGDDEDRLHERIKREEHRPAAGRPAGRRGPRPGRGPPRPRHRAGGGAAMSRAERLPIRRALVSVFDKEGLDRLAAAWPAPGSRSSPPARPRPPSRVTASASPGLRS